MKYRLAEPRLPLNYELLSTLQGVVRFQRFFLNMHYLLILLLLVCGRSLPALAQRPNLPARYVLSGWKDDTAYWAKKTFISIEPTCSHNNVPVITICQHEPSDSQLEIHPRLQYIFYLPPPEFAAVERLIRYSMAKAQRQVPVRDPVMCYALEMYFHSPRLSSARILDDKLWMTAFFSSLLEEVACHEHDVSAATQATLLPALRRQLYHVTAR